jgi:hypothetical protein
MADAFRCELQAYFEGDRRLAKVSEHAGLVRLIGAANTQALLDARNTVVVSLLTELRRAVPENVALILRTATSPFHTGGKTAGAVKDLAPHADGMVFSFFSMPFAKFKNEVVAVPQDILRARPAWAGVSLAMDLPECQDEPDFRARMGLLRAQGFERFAFYHYGLMPRPCLAWIKSALA